MTQFSIGSSRGLPSRLGLLCLPDHPIHIIGEDVHLVGEAVQGTPDLVLTRRLLHKVRLEAHPQPEGQGQGAAGPQESETNAPGARSAFAVLFP